MLNLKVMPITSKCYVEKTYVTSFGGTQKTADAMRAVNYSGSSWDMWDCITKACENSTDLLLFPKYTIGGYLMGSLDPADYSVHNNAVNGTHSILTGIASRINSTLGGSTHKLVVGFGATERDEYGRFYQTYFFVDRNGVVGKVRANHILKNSYQDDRKFWQGDSNITVVNLTDSSGNSKVKVSVLTDQDICFPEQAKRAVDQGAELLVIPYCCPADIAHGTNTKTTLFDQTRLGFGMHYLAKRLGAFAVCINHCGSTVRLDGGSGTIEAAGWSEVIRPSGFTSWAEGTLWSNESNFVTPPTLLAQDLTDAYNSTYYDNMFY